MRRNALRLYDCVAYRKQPSTGKLQRIKKSKKERGCVPATFITGSYYSKHSIKNSFNGSVITVSLASPIALFIPA